MSNFNRKYTPEELDFIKAHAMDDLPLDKIVAMFNEQFQEHKITRDCLTWIMRKEGIKHKRVSHIRAQSKNAIGTVIADKTGRRCRVKTENGYVYATDYFTKLYGLPENERIIHLNGDYTDFSRENIVTVRRDVWSALQWRKWVFDDPERTKAAILCAELLLMFPEITKDENSFLKARRNR